MRIPRSVSEAEQTRFNPTQAWNRLTEFQEILPLVLPSAANLSRARQMHLAQGVSLWDALILAACLEAGVNVLYSEDVPALKHFETVRVVNPFE